MIGERIKQPVQPSGLSMQALVSKVIISANMVKKIRARPGMPSSGFYLN